ncbi:MAG: hypothetical protein K1W04_08685 [Oscillospiraceae bacterium]
MFTPTLATLLRGSASTQEEAQEVLRESLKSLSKEDAQAKLKLLYAEAKSLAKPFGETVEGILREKGFVKQWGGQEKIDIPKVAKLTGLNPGIFRTNMWKSDCVVDMALVISMAIGLKLSPILTDRLLMSAGLAFRLDNPEHLAYIFLLEYCRDLTIPECNKILDSLGIRKTRQLGSRHRGKDGEFEGYHKDED